MQSIHKKVMTDLLKISSSLSLLLILSACSSVNLITNKNFQANDTQWDQLYLRGVFNWWEADDKFKLTKSGNFLYSTTVNLVADGQPYDFKFSDKDWSPGLNCGYLVQDSDEIIQLNAIVKADCNTPVNNFKFTPTSSGNYTFHFLALPGKEPEVYITKV